MIWRLIAWAIDTLLPLAPLEPPKVRVFGIAADNIADGTTREALDDWWERAYGSHYSRPERQ